MFLVCSPSSAIALTVSTMRSALKPMAKGPASSCTPLVSSPNFGTETFDLGAVRPHLIAEASRRRLRPRQLRGRALELLLQCRIGPGLPQLVGELSDLCRIGAHIGLRLGKANHQLSGVDANLQGEGVSH